MDIDKSTLKIYKHETNHNSPLQEVSTPMSQLNRRSYVAGQQLDQPNHALYNYCKVMHVPKMGAAPAMITIFTGLILLLFLAALGESLLTAVLAGASVSAVFAFLFWLAYRYRVGASKRLNSYLAENGGQLMFSDFASAQPFVNDQFRLGRYYLFIRNGAVIRLDSIDDIVRIVGRSGVYLSLTVKDENGSMSLPLCRVHLLKAAQEIDEIRQAVMQRRLSV